MSGDRRLMACVGGISAAAEAAKRARSGTAVRPIDDSAPAATASAAAGRGSDSSAASAARRGTTGAQSKNPNLPSFQKVRPAGPSVLVSRVENQPIVVSWLLRPEVAQALLHTTLFAPCIEHWRRVTIVCVHSRSPRDRAASASTCNWANQDVRSQQQVSFCFLAGAGG